MICLKNIILIISEIAKKIEIYFESLHLHNMNPLVKNTTRQYGARCRDFKVQLIYSENITGDMIFDRTRLLFRNILPHQGTTMIEVHALQDVTDMPEVLGYPHTDDAEAIARYHAKYGPYTPDEFEEKFDRLFFVHTNERNDTTGQFRKLHILKTMYSIAFKSILLIKEYSEHLLLFLYEQAFDYFTLFDEDYLKSHPKGEAKKDETLFHIRRYIERVDELLHEYPYLALRIEASLLDRFLETKSYKHLRQGLQQFWIDPLRARVIAKHHDLYFRDLWFHFMNRNFRLPDCICFYIIEWLLFTKTNTFVGESILSLLLRTHNRMLESTDNDLAHKFKQVTRDVRAEHGLFVDIINVEIFT